MANDTASVTRSIVTPGGEAQTDFRSGIIDEVVGMLAPPAPGENLVGYGSFEQDDLQAWTVGAGWITGFPQSDAPHGIACARLVATVGQTSGELTTDLIAVDSSVLIHTVGFEARFLSWTAGYGRCLLRQYDETGALIDESVVAEFSPVTDRVSLGIHVLIPVGSTWVQVANSVVAVQELYEQVVMGEETTHVRLVFEAVTGAFVLEIDAVQMCTGGLAGFKAAAREYIEGTAILPGTVPPEALDTTPPAIPTGVTMTTDATLNADGTAVSRVYVSLTHPTDADYQSCEVQVTGEYTQSNPSDPDTRTPVWSFARSYTLPKDGTRIVHEPAIGGRPYWARARSMDTTGNRSAYSAIALLPAATDADAPPIPVIAQAVSGFRSVGVWWDAVDAIDLSHYEVRWRPRESIVVVEGVPTVQVQEWETARTKGTVYVATDLETTDNGPNPADPEDVAYHGYTYHSFQVRAVDLSDNVRHGRSQRIVVGVAASLGATSVVIADARGLIPGAPLLWDDDATTHRIDALVMDGNGVSGTLTVSPPLAEARAVGDVGNSVYVSMMPVLATDDPYAGWSDVMLGYPTLTGQNDISANAILANMLAAGSVIAGKLAAGSINTGDLFATGVITGDAIATNTLTSDHITTDGLSANIIKGGTLILGGMPTGDPDDPAQHAVLSLLTEEEDEFGRIDGRGLLLMDPANRARQVRFRDGVLEFTETGNPDDPDDAATIWGTAIDARGVTADSIQVGTAPGGHNAIPNSSFERTPLTSVAQSHTWTNAGAGGDQTYWGGATTLLSGSINIDTTTGDLNLTDVTY